jgi:hypothetical protein
MSLESQSAVSVRIDADGLGDLGVWSRRTGGNADSEETKFPPGGMADEISLGGRGTFDNITVAKLFRDLIPYRRSLLNARGGARVTVSDQPLDRDKNPIGVPTVYVGTLKAVNFGDSDSTSNDPKLIELEITTDGIAA